MHQIDLSVFSFSLSLLCTILVRFHNSGRLTCGGKYKKVSIVTTNTVTISSLNVNLRWIQQTKYKNQSWKASDKSMEVYTVQRKTKLRCFL